MLLTQNSTMSRKELAWQRWVLQSARTWDDVAGIIQVIGVTAIDDDHRKFTQYALDLNLIIEAFNNRDVSFDNLHKGSEIFDKLLEYAEVHFSREDRIMRRMDSPMLAVHLEQHGKFMGMIEDHYAEFKRGRLQMVSGLKLSILDWWVNHINVIDYKTFVLGKTENMQVES